MVACGLGCDGSSVVGGTVDAALDVPVEGGLDGGTMDAPRVCAMDEVLCGGDCARLATSDAHCGACGNACGAGRGCAMGVCVTRWACAGAAGSSDVCADLQNDRAHCGACGTACAAGQVCVAGACALSCPSSQTNCGGSCRDLQTDPAHCGMCGTGCALGTGVRRAGSA
jgi:hypothetical protein